MQSPQLVTFDDMLKRHGKRPALNLLKTMESLAQVSNVVIILDYEVRFEKALLSICNTNFAGEQKC